MSGRTEPVTLGEPIARYLARIEAHLGRFAAGHDPWGHLLAIERLARAARGEWWEEQRESGRRSREP